MSYSVSNITVFHQLSVLLTYFYSFLKVIMKFFPKGKDGMKRKNRNNIQVLICL